MTSNELAESRQFARDSKLEFERNRNAPPVEYNANDFDEACKALKLDESHLPSKMKEPPDPHVKARTNHFAEDSVQIIDEYMKYNAEIEEYIATRAVDDEKFPERLRDCFRKVYRELAGGDNPEFGDDLFWGMICKLTKGHKKDEGAIKALLIHYFARCEVFPWVPGGVENDSSDETHFFKE